MRSEIRQGFYGKSRGVGMEWLGGLLPVGPVCGHVPMLAGFVAIVGRLGMFECPFWFGVA